MLKHDLNTWYERNYTVYISLLVFLNLLSLALSSRRGNESAIVAVVNV